MSAKEEAFKNEFQFASSSIVAHIVRGVLVGIVVGCIVSSFRFLIEHIFHFVQGVYKEMSGQPFYLFAMLLGYGVIVLIAGRLIRTNRDIKGSGIPQVEAELKGLLAVSWWDTLWKKYILGVLAIGSGLMLGREGPSIQLGAMGGKGVAHHLKVSPVEERSLIASGAAAGLAAAFNAPIAGLLFVVEEVYHHFSRFFWISTLAASLTANFISLNVFGQTPVLHMPQNIPPLHLSQYWIYLFLGVFLGAAGYVYEIVVLNIGSLYRLLEKIFHVPSHYSSLFAFVLILPIGYFLPQILGGGNQLVLDLARVPYPVLTILLYFAIRFIWSMLSYGSGLPGGIFLPILALGSLLGAIVGTFLQNIGFISQNQLPLFIILGMSGYFGAISKAPLTAMILVTEMVGDIRSLMPLGMVTLLAYMIMDLFHGAPVYEAMLEQLLPDKAQEEGELTLIEIPVSEKIAGKQVHELHLPQDILITTQIRSGKSYTVNGATRLYLGDSIFVVVKESEIGRVKDILL